MKYMTTKEYAEMMRVSPKTVRRWIKSGKIKAIKIGRRWLIPVEEHERKRKIVIYARVSTHGQKKDLENQVRALEEHLRSIGIDDYIIIKDVGSGLKWNRRGFQKLLRMVVRGEVSDVFIAFKDRLSRFGFDVLKFFFFAFNCRIHVVFKEDLSPIEEIVDDLISIVTHFAGRIYGLRSHKYKKFVRKFKTLLVGNS